MRSLICTVCLIGQCIEGMTVLGYISGRSFKLHKTCQVVIDKEYIIIWYNFQPCCIAGNRYITPGSLLSEHPLYINFPFLRLISFFFLLSDESDGLQTLIGGLVPDAYL